MKICEANLMTDIGVRRMNNHLKDLCAFGANAKIRLHKPFQFEATAWAMLDYAHRWEKTTRIIELGSASSLIALRLAENGFPVAVVNDKFHGEFIEAAKEPARDIAIFPRPIRAPWTRFFSGIADVVSCFNIDEVLPDTMEGKFKESVDHLLYLLGSGGLLLITASVKLKHDGIGIECCALERELAAMGWPHGLNKRDLFAGSVLGDGTACLCFAAEK